MTAIDARLVPVAADAADRAVRSPARDRAFLGRRGRAETGRGPGEATFVAVVALVVASVGAWAAAAGVDAQRLVVLLALAPLLEETAFRAGLHEALLRRPRLASQANAVTAVAFGLLHALLQGHVLAVAVALPAWVVGVAYERRRRVRPCVALHALFNALWIAWVVAGPATT